MNKWARRQMQEQLARAHAVSDMALRDGLSRAIALDIYASELFRAMTPLEESDRAAALETAEAILLPMKVASHA